MKWQKLDKESSATMKTDKRILLTDCDADFMDMIAYKNWPNQGEEWYSLLDEDNYTIDHIMREFTHFCLVDQPERSLNVKDEGNKGQE